MNTAMSGQVRRYEGAVVTGKGSLASYWLKPYSSDGQSMTAYIDVVTMGGDGKPGETTGAQVAGRAQRHAPERDCGAVRREPGVLRRRGPPPGLLRDAASPSSRRDDRGRGLSGLRGISPDLLRAAPCVRGPGPRGARGGQAGPQGPAQSFGRGGRVRTPGKGRQPSAVGGPARRADLRALRRQLAPAHSGTPLGAQKWPAGEACEAAVTRAGEESTRSCGPRCWPGRAPTVRPPAAWSASGSGGSQPGGQRGRSW